MIRVDLIDPPAYSPPYDAALAGALAAAGASVRLLTSEFAYGPTPVPDRYRVEHRFYRLAVGKAGSRLRQFTKLAEHVPDMLLLRGDHGADVTHFQWLTIPELDLRLLPADRPVVLTIHDPLQRGRAPGRPRLRHGAFSRVDAVIVHSEYARENVVATHGLEPERVHVIRHGALGVGPSPEGVGRLPDGWAPDPGVPVVMCFGLIRPYKGLETLLAAWRGLAGAELWIVGRPMTDISALVAGAPPGVRFLPRFVSNAEEEALFARADVIVLPYERSERFGFSGVLATALGLGKAIVASDVGGFAEVGTLGAARIFPAGDREALQQALSSLLADPVAREQLAAAARSAAADTFSWEAAARATLELYERIRA